MSRKRITPNQSLFSWRMSASVANGDRLHDGGSSSGQAGYGAKGHHAQAGPLVDAPDESGAETLGKS